MLNAFQFGGILQIVGIPSGLLRGLLQGGAGFWFPLGGFGSLHGALQLRHLFGQRLRCALLLLQLLFPVGDIRRRLLARLPLVASVVRQGLAGLGIMLFRSQAGLQAVDGRPALGVLLLRRCQFRHRALQAGNLS
ncbi:hypothetical protein [Haliea sp.]|uniref:hypothetical protein n=1 Tax=Haliea sp. TaxID=1932666 RepID=UPI00352973AD